MTQNFAHYLLWTVGAILLGALHVSTFRLTQTILIQDRMAALKGVAFTPTPKWLLHGLPVLAILGGSLLAVLMHLPDASVGTILLGVLLISSVPAWLVFRPVAYSVELESDVADDWILLALIGAVTALYWPFATWMFVRFHQEPLLYLVSWMCLPIFGLLFVCWVMTTALDFLYRDIQL